MPYTGNHSMGTANVILQGAAGTNAALANLGQGLFSARVRAKMEEEMAAEKADQLKAIEGYNKGVETMLQSIGGTDPQAQQILTRAAEMSPREKASFFSTVQERFFGGIAERKQAAKQRQLASVMQQLAQYQGGTGRGVITVENQDAMSKLLANPGVASAVDAFRLTGDPEVAARLGGMMTEAPKPIPGGDRPITSPGGEYFWSGSQWQTTPNQKPPPSSSEERLLEKLWDPNLSPQQRFEIEVVLGLWKQNPNTGKWERAQSAPPTGTGAGGGTPQPPINFNMNGVNY